MIERTQHHTTVPALGFGTWQLRGDECQAAVDIALETGYRHIDTAEMYENEADIGKSLSSSGIPREDLFLTTKVWIEHLDRQGVQDVLSASLDKLQTDYVNLLLIHWPSGTVSLDETLEAMNAVRDQGKTRQIGVSNFPAAHLKDAIRISDAPIFTDQVEFHPFLGEKLIRKACLEHDVLLTAYSPLARGGVVDHPVLKEIADTYGKSTVQVTLRWILQLGNTMAVPKASSPDHIRANFDIFDFELAPVDMDRIATLDRNERVINPEFAPDWSAV